MTSVAHFIKYAINGSVLEVLELLIHLSATGNKLLHTSLSMQDILG